MGLGRRICQLRLEKQLTQFELAHIIGVTRAGLSHYENGRRQPGYETIKQLAVFFNVSVEYLLEGNKRALVINR